MRHVRLTRILAPVLNGVDLSKFRVGEIIRVPEAVAAMLVREGWAEIVSEGEPVKSDSRFGSIYSSDS